ncbi:MAG: hypothetical protein ACFB14_01150 [Leptolyngbyaceae cyanobacterium]
MSRLPRRTLRVKPPLRGRAATQHYRGEFAPISAVNRPLRPSYTTRALPGKRQKPPEQPHPKPPQDYDSGPSGNLFDSQKRWPWLVVIALVVISLLLLERLM